MTILKQIENLAEWFRVNVAPVHKSKVPPEKGKAITKDYQFVLANPSVHTFLFPDVEEFDPEGQPLQPAPSMILQLLDGMEESEARGGTSGTMRFRLVFSLWNPGLHTGEEFKRTADGWRDLFTLMDTTHARMKKARILNGHTIRGGRIDFAPLKEGGALIDSFPFFYGETNFETGFYKAVETDIVEKLTH